MKAKLWLMAGCALLFGTQAFGNYFGNIAAPVEPGQVTLGFGFTSIKRDLEQTLVIESNFFGTLSADVSDELEFSELLGSIGIGLSDSDEIEIRLGTIELEEEGAENEEGTEFSLAYRHLFKILGGSADSALLVRLSFAEFDNSELEGDFNQLDVAFAFAKEIDSAVNLYGGFAVSRIDGEVRFNEQTLRELEILLFLPANDISSVKIEFEQDDFFGLFGGVEFSLGGPFHLGIELHLVFEEAIVLFARLPL